MAYTVSFDVQMAAPANDLTSGKVPKFEPSGKYSNVIKYKPKTTSFKTAADQVTSMVSACGEAVDAKWLKKQVEWVTTVKQGREVLDSAWKGGSIRKFKDGKTWLYKRLHEEANWEMIRASANAEIEADYETRNNARKLAYEEDLHKRIGVLQDGLDNLAKETATFNNQVARLSQELDCYIQKLSKAEGEASRAREQLQQMTDELDSLGLFAIAKKRDLRFRISELSKELASLESDVSGASEAKKKAIAAKSSKQRVLNERLGEQAELEEKLRALKEDLSKGCEPLPITPKERVGRMSKLMALWASPVSPQWCAENVAGVASVDEARKAFSSTEGKKVFVKLDSKLFSLADESAYDAG